MDEFSQAFTLNDLIEKYHKEPIRYISVHLLPDEFNDFVLAISWKVLEETHFKMFKQQPQSEILLFSHSLSEQYASWHQKICQWFDSPHVPLKLTNQ